MILFINCSLYPMILWTPLMALASSSTFFTWMMMEVSTLTFITIIILSKKNFSKSTSNMQWPSTISYFLIQILFSSFLLFSIIMIKVTLLSPLNHEIFLNIYTLTLLGKLGIIPLYSWFPKLMKMLNWTNCLILMTIQKIIPFIFLFYQYSIYIMIFSILLTPLISILNTAQTQNFKIILAFSSMNHSSWMTFMLILSMKMWFIYFSIYSVLNFFICMWLKKFNVTYIPMLNISANRISLINKLFYILMFFSLGGLPPLLGFYSKFMAVFVSMSSLFYIFIKFITLWMVIMSALILYLYIRAVSPLLFNFSMSLKPSPINLNEPVFPLILSSTFMVMIFSIWLFF